MSEYSIAYNGLTLSPANGYTVFMQDGAAGAPIRMSMADLTGQDGAAIYASRYGARPIVFRGTVSTPDPVTFFEKRRNLINAFSRFPLTSELSITTWDGNTFTIPATVRQAPIIVDRTGKRTQIDFQVELICGDPFLNTGGEEEYTIISTPIQRGFPLPAPLPMPLGLNTSGTSVIINNVGDTDSIPSFRIDGQVQNLTVRNLTTGQFFNISSNIPDGRYVLIYKLNGDVFVQLDGVTNYYQNFSGTIFPIVRGLNTITAVSTSSNENALITITYRNKRNGI